MHQNPAFHIKHTPRPRITKHDHPIRAQSVRCLVVDLQQRGRDFESTVEGSSQCVPIEGFAVSELGICWEEKAYRIVLISMRTRIRG